MTTLVTLYTSGFRGTAPQFTDHRRRDDESTGCGVKLGMHFDDPPALIEARERGEVKPCQRRGCKAVA